MKLLLVSSLISATAAFAPSSSLSTRHPGAATFLRSIETTDDTTEETIVTPEPLLSQDEPSKEADYQPLEVNAYGSNSPSSTAGETAAAMNGWVPDDSKPCFGLPGAIAPTGYFDPIGFCRYGNTLSDVKRYREAEVQHGRVAMLAAVGYLAGEAIPGPFSLTGPANDQLQQLPLPAFVFLTLGIAAAELKRAKIGWVEPSYKPGSRTLWTLRDEYYPGDVGFDPLNFKPREAKAFADMQTRELQNGRLAMIGVIGMMSQELVNHKTIGATIDFYEKVYSGINPYDY